MLAGHFFRLEDLQLFRYVHLPYQHLNYLVDVVPELYHQLNLFLPSQQLLNPATPQSVNLAPDVPAIFLRHSAHRNPHKC